MDKIKLKEALIKVRHEFMEDGIFHTHKYNGICPVVHSMNYYKKLNYSEAQAVIDYLMEHKPKQMHSKNLFFAPRDAENRIKYLDNLIDSL